MFSTLGILLHHKTKRFHASFSRLRLVARIIKLLAVAYTLIVVLGFGFFLDSILREVFPSEPGILIVNRYLMYSLLLSFAIQFFLLELPSVALKPYLVIPLTKQSLVIAYLFFYFSNIINYLPVLFLLPYWAKVVLRTEAATSASRWLIGLIVMSLAGSFTVLLLRMFLYTRTGLFFLLIGGTIIVRNIANASPLTFYSSLLFDGLLYGSNRSLTIPLVLGIGSFSLTVHYLKKRLFIDLT